MKKIFNSLIGLGLGMLIPKLFSNDIHSIKTTIIISICSITLGMIFYYINEFKELKS